MPKDNIVIYAARGRDRSQGFLHTGDSMGPEVRRAKREMRDPIIYVSPMCRDRTQGFLHTGDSAGPEVEDLEERKARHVVERGRVRRKYAISAAD